MRVPRGKGSGTQAVSLPENYLLDRDDATPPGADAEDEFSGGLSVCDVIDCRNLSRCSSGETEPKLWPARAA